MDKISLIDVNKPEKVKDVINELIDNQTATPEVTKEDVGLSNVDNTSDADKPVSIYQRTYIDSQDEKSVKLSSDTAQTIDSDLTIAEGCALSAQQSDGENVNVASVTSTDTEKLVVGDTKIPLILEYSQSNSISNPQVIYLDSTDIERTDYLALLSDVTALEDKLNDVIAQKASLQIVSALPTTDINESVLYLVAKTNATTNNSYDEYVYVNGEWEYLGLRKIDLTDYYTKAETDAQISSLSASVGSRIQSLEGSVNALSNQINETNCNTISTAVKESLAEDFSTVNANIDALSTQISSGSSAIEIDTSHLNSLIESLEFVASKRKYYEPLPENYEVADASTYTVTSIQDTMKGEFIAGLETIPTYSLPFVYFTAQVGCLYCLEINNTMYSYKKDTKTIKVYLNGELVKTLTVPTASDSYSSSQLANITYGFLATQEYNELKLEYISNTNNSFIPKLVSVTLHGPNGKINSCIPKFKVERVFDNYYIYKRDNISYLSFITPIDNPEILPNSSQSFITNGYTQIGATMNKPASSDGVLVGIYDMYANAKNIAVGKVNGSETGTNSAHTYIYAIMMGFQYESNTMLFCFALNSANTLLQGNVSNSNAPTFYSVKHTVEGKIVKLTQICELTNVPFTYMRMVGVTLDNNDNYLLYQKSGSTYKSLYIGKGDRWNMGIVAKNLNGTNVRLILRSYMYRNNQWLREEFLIYNTGTTMTVTKLDSYLLEGNYDFVYCGANNDFFSQTNGDFSLNKHLPVDYTEYITFQTKDTTDETTDENTEEIPRLT